MAKPFDYSRWDNIELSDDESDLHPNIDKDSWFRMKHRARLEREAKEDEEKAAMAEADEAASRRVKELRRRLARLAAAPAGAEGSCADEEDEFADDEEALQAEVDELEAAMAKRAARAAEIDRRRAWNIDNICRVKEERTVFSTRDAPSLAAADYQPDLGDEGAAAEEGGAADAAAPAPA
eukprot:CAMPEP_0198434832 /NCGR_PEP_ID=MMETSP1452-20131203/34832_1 /TAXON_ID=1181717 /ORGANISM="Synchroma pusillum, Strain CCMP3072" /LENGTH=179 /DNA_ID=CAMNT_0044155351 /DNA_START=55 /DNA_END=590 /DNA_ORIENTATION=+